MNTVFDVLISKTNEELTSAETYLSGGKAKDFADYQYVCGQIRGLRAAQFQIKDLAKNYMEDDDDDN